MNLDEFNKKIDDIIVALDSEIKQFDNIYLMSLINQMELHSTNPSASASNLPDGFVQKFHYLNGLTCVFG